MIRILIPGVPVGKGRPRMTRTGHAYTPEKTRTYEDKIALFAHEAMGGCPPLTGHLTLNVTAIFPIPESWSKKKKISALNFEIFPGKPDCDNLLKTIDAMNSIVWRDDAQICTATIRKMYGEVPSLLIEVEEVV